MTDFDRLTRAAYHQERVAARRLARSARLDEAQALRQTLEHSAGPSGLAALLATREAEHEAAAARSAARLARADDRRRARANRDADGAAPWRAWFDGSAFPNPGQCGIGALLKGPNGEVVEISRPAGYGNSSQAEYLALIAVLRAAVDHGAAELTVYGDSQGIIDDACGPDSRAAASLAELRSEARELMTRFTHIALRWVPRHRNGAADVLSQRARQ